MYTLSQVGVLLATSSTHFITVYLKDILARPSSYRYTVLFRRLCSVAYLLPRTYWALTLKGQLLAVPLSECQAQPSIYRCARLECSTNLLLVCL